jgi:hypothetical protein
MEEGMEDTGNSGDRISRNTLPIEIGEQRIRRQDMPRGDGTGRNGFGPMTGRGMGYCAGYDVPGYVNGGGFGNRRFFGRGAGLGLGYRYGGRYGYGLRSRRFAPVAPAYDLYDAASEADDLKLHAEALERELQGVRNRLNVLEKEGSKGEDTV